MLLGVLTGDMLLEISMRDVLLEVLPEAFLEASSGESR